MTERILFLTGNLQDGPDPSEVGLNGVYESAADAPLYNNKRRYVKEDNAAIILAFDENGNWILTDLAILEADGPCAGYFISRQDGLDSPTEASVWWRACSSRENEGSWRQHDRARCLSLTASGAVHWDRHLQAQRDEVAGWGPTLVVTGVRPVRGRAFVNGVYARAPTQQSVGCPVYTNKALGLSLWYSKGAVWVMTPSAQVATGDYTHNVILESPYAGQNHLPAIDRWTEPARARSASPSVVLVCRRTDLHGVVKTVGSGRQPVLQLPFLRRVPDRLTPAYRPVPMWTRDAVLTVLLVGMRLRAQRLPRLPYELWCLVLERIRLRACGRPVSRTPSMAARTEIELWSVRHRARELEAQVQAQQAQLDALQATVAALVERAGC